MMTNDANLNLIFDASRETIDQYFGSSTPVQEVHAVVENVIGLEDYGLGSVSMDTENPRLRIAVGAAEATGIAIAFDVDPDESDTLYRYITGSLFAGYVMVANVVGRDSAHSEVGNTFHRSLMDSARIASVVEDCSWESLGQIGASTEILKIMEQTTNGLPEIAAINMHRIGSGLILAAEKMIASDSRPMDELKGDMQKAFIIDMRNAVEQDLIALTAGGFTSEHKKRVLTEKIIERVIKQRGIGLLFPASVAEVEGMSLVLDKASQDDTIKSMVDCAMNTDELWCRVIDLSDGHSVGYEDDELPMTITDTQLHD